MKAVIKKLFFNKKYFSEKINITYKYADNREVTVEAELGDNLLKLAHKNKIDLEGACDCSLACSTCHVILEDKLYDELEEPSEEEFNLLDRASGLTPTSRLGCQVQVTNKLKGALIKIPLYSVNMYVDGTKPIPH